MWSEWYLSDSLANLNESWCTTTVVKAFSSENSVNTQHSIQDFECHGSGRGSYIRPGRASRELSPGWMPEKHQTFLSSLFRVRFINKFCWTPSIACFARGWQHWRDGNFTHDDDDDDDASRATSIFFFTTLETVRVTVSRVLWFWSRVHISCILKMSKVCPTRVFYHGT